MPVAWDFPDGAKRLIITGAAGMSTAVDAPAPHGVAPFFAWRESSGSLGWSTIDTSGAGPGGSIDVPLRPLADDERLVGSDIDDESGTELFPGARVVPVRLDGADPLPGPPAAWTSLDAVVLDASAIARLDGTAREVLLAGGTTIAVPAEPRSPVPPDAVWPWKLRDRLWVLSPPLPAINISLADDAYAPLDAWNPPAPGHLRRQVVLIAVLYSILAVGLALSRSKLALAAGAVLAVAFIAGILLWQRHEPAAMIAIGEVRTDGTTIGVRERWIFSKGRQTGVVREPFVDLTIPLFADDASEGPSGATLCCDSDGRPNGIDYPTAPDREMVFVARSIVAPSAVAGTSIAATSPDGSSPLRMLMRSFYPGQEVESAIAPPSSADDVDTWPGLRLSPPSVVGK